MKKYSVTDLILWEDNDFITVNKPPFLSTLEDRTDPVNLLALVRGYCETAQACHRLDKDTSGLIVFAKNPEAYRHMSMQFEHRKVEKIYHAIVDGVHDFKQHLVDAPILAAPDGIVKISKRDGKPAQTYFTTLVAYRQHSLIECRPITGRMHQIRIHLSVLNASITGDEQYGGKPLYLSAIKRGFNLKKNTEEEPLMKRMALHAKSLIFKSMKDEELTLDAPYPKDFQALIRQLEANK
ncbi:MAG: RluA family pseudouridine synthase [Cyclobacteriaceae bacterium]|nr:RluA family pseudouridine synthase [Cyclobacteriaceae bacterium]